MLHRGAHFVLTHLITGCVTVHTVLAVHAGLYEAALGVWACVQPGLLTATHSDISVHTSLRTMLHRGAHFVLTHLITG